MQGCNLNDETLFLQDHIRNREWEIITFSFSRARVIREDRLRDNR